MPPRSIHVTTCLWGDWHLDVMRRITLPTLLSPGNLPAMSRRLHARYRIATTPADRQRIEAWPIFARLADCVQVEWITENASPEIIYHVEWYKRAIADAGADNAYCFMAYSDVAWSDGTFAHCVDAIDAGKVGVAIPYLRTISETCLPDIAGRAVDAPITLPPGELVRLGLRHMHPLSAAAMAEGRHARPSLEALWRVPDEGLLLREMTRQLCLVDATRLNTNRFWMVGVGATIDAVHVGSDSDDMLMLSFAPLLKDLPIYIPGHAVQPVDLARMSLHPANDMPLVKDFARRNVRLHYGSRNERRWRRAERRADAFINKALFMREFLRVWQAIQASGCSHASRLMSIALHATDLSTRWPHDGPVTAFIPNDEAVQRQGWHTLEPLLAPDAAHDLVGVVLGHVAVGTPPSVGAAASSPLVTLSGKALQWAIKPDGELVGDAKIVARLDVPPHVICIVDRLLVPLPAPASLRPPPETVAAGHGDDARAATQALSPPPIDHADADDEIAGDYQRFLRDFAVDLGGSSPERQARAAAAALYQAGLYRHKLLFLHDLMQRFAAAGGPTDPQPAFFEQCAALIGGEPGLLRAERYYRLATRLVPDFSEALYALAVLRRRSHAADEAIAMFEAAARARPHPNALPHAHVAANSFRQLAELHRDLGREGAAEACFRQALEQVGNHGVYHAEIADFMRARGHHAEAARGYEQVMPYTHLYVTEFNQPDFPPEERLPPGLAGRPCDPLAITAVAAAPGRGTVVYWWHVYLSLPPGVTPASSAQLLQWARDGRKPPAATSIEALPRVGGLLRRSLARLHSGW